MSSCRETSFSHFTSLPAELRLRIWQLAFSPHITRWVRADDEAKSASNRFPYSRRRNVIYHVCREAREAIFLLSKFARLDGEGRHLYSPSQDYLHLDASWRELAKPQLPVDPFTSLPFDYRLIRRIMINPNYTDERMKPGLAFQRLSSLREILIVADEKSVGLKDKFMLASVYDLQKYFEGVKRRDPTIVVPHIAVGCLGWVGDDRLMMSHSTEDRRQLIAVFESQGEMKDHLGRMRDEETKFLKKTFSRKAGFKLKFRPGHSEEQAHYGRALLDDERPSNANCYNEPPESEAGTSGEEVVPLSPEVDELPTYADTTTSVG